MKLSDIAQRARELHAVGEPAPTIDGWEIIGPPDCPILARRTIIGNRLFKVLWHRWYPDARDRDPHDHPRPFVTIVLRGGYDDISPCPECLGTGNDCSGDYVMSLPCPPCGGTGEVVDALKRFSVRYRRAEFAHVTAISAAGATTLCIMGRPVRDWGFWRGGRWFKWAEYERRFGFHFRCERADDAVPSALPAVPLTEDETL